MADNFLQIARNAAAVIGIQDFGSLINNTEPHVRAMVVHLNRGGKNLVRMRNTFGASWVVLTVEHVFRTIPGQDEYQLPDDFQILVDGTIWDRDTYREARGPLSPQEWQTVKSGLIETTAIAPNFRIRRSSTGLRRAFYVDPVPGGEEDLVIEYVTDTWVVNADRNQRFNSVQTDTDEPLFDDDLVEMDLIWRFKQSRGMSFAAELAEFELERDKRFSYDSGLRTLTVGRTRAYFGRRSQVPETGFGITA